MKIKRALVTGATGFVGQHLLRHLLQSDWQVDAIVRPSSDVSELPKEGETLRLHEHSGSTASMQAIVAEAQPDVVFHLASMVLSEQQPEDVERLIRSNILFGTQLVEAMTHADVRSLINTGTSWQHYRNQNYSPVNLYAATKQAFDALLQYYVEARGLQVITLKLTDTYGPNDRRPKLINLLRSCASDHEPLAMTPGEQLIDLVHVDDVARAFILAAERLESNQVKGQECYAVSCGQPISLRELVKQIEHCLGRGLPVLWGARPYREREVMRPWGGKALPGWMPLIKLEEGLRGLFNGE